MEVHTLVERNCQRAAAEDQARRERWQQAQQLGAEATAASIEFSDEPVVNTV